MPDIATPGLEPINEEDLNLERKFGKVEEKAVDNMIGKPINAEIPEKESESAKEIIPAEKDEAYGKIMAKVKSSGTDDIKPDEVKDDAKKTFEKQDAESQIQHLVDIAGNKGILHAVKVARHLEDNYVLDMFHDKLLSEELHAALVKKGLINDNL